MVVVRVESLRDLALVQGFIQASHLAEMLTDVFVRSSVAGVECDGPAVLFFCSRPTQVTHPVIRKDCLRLGRFRVESQCCLFSFSCDGGVFARNLWQSSVGVR